MKLFADKLLATLVATCALAGVPDQARSQAAADYPAKPIRMVISSPAGGGVDVIVRLTGDRLMRTKGWSTIMDNRAGAGGNIGTETVAKATPDGYTLLGTTNNHTMNPFIYKNAGYDPTKDFAAIVQLTEAPSVMITNPQSAYRSLKDVINAARAQPGKIVYGTSGSGTPTHAAGEMIKKAANLDLTHIPYKGGALANQDVMAGQIALGMAALPAVAANIQAGTLRAIAVTSPKRWVTLPDVPAVSEYGYPGFSHMTWIGCFAPTGTPASIVARLNRELVAVLTTPDMRERVLGVGAQVVAKSPADFEAMLKADYAANGKLASQIGLKVQ